MYCFQNQLTMLNLGKNIALKHLYCDSNNLTQLNIKNGKNENLGQLYADKNPLLKCIEVDFPALANVSFWKKDATATYSTQCGVATNDLFAASSVAVFPNPVTDDCNIAFDFEYNCDVTVHILGLNGKVLQSNIFKNMSKNNEKINVQNLPNGVYVLQTVIGDQQASRKLVIAR